MDGFLLTRSDKTILSETKDYLKQYFVIKDMEKPKYFLGIGVVFQKNGLLLS